MKKIKIEQDDETLNNRLRRPMVFKQLVEMDIDVNEKIEIIDLCTPTVEQDQLFNIPKFSTTKSISIRIPEQFPNFHQRLAIIPWFPIPETQDQGYPLLVNVPGIYIHL